MSSTSLNDTIQADPGLSALEYQHQDNSEQTSELHGEKKTGGKKDESSIPTSLQLSLLLS
jgi:hypothetical protein